MNQILTIFKKYLYVHVIFLIIMTLFRGAFFIHYNTVENIDDFYIDILNAFILGLRLDLTVVGYIQALPTILLMLLYFIKKDFLIKFFAKISMFYLFVCYVIVTLLLCADFGFYSYFKDHINILFFGLFDDDTKALMITFWQNYSVVMILSIFCIYLYGSFKIIKLIFSNNDENTFSIFLNRLPLVTFLVFIGLNFLAIRGTFGMYPLGKMIPNVSSNDFINKVSHNGFRAFTTAYGVRKKYLKNKYDLIKATGFKGNIEEAFRIHTGKTDIDTKNLLNNITYTTQKVDDKDYNVIVLMVESFGLPITKYQSEEFNILGNLKQHFEEDILFTNFISAGDGTISSLEALLLNIPHRPNSFPFSQSTYKQTSFKYTPAFLYNESGYETSFIYGGDLSWRNLGSFIQYQGYQNVEGKIKIYNDLKNKNKNKEEYFHPWGIFDEHLYSHILTKLKKTDKKQFIVALSTNNHPPYNIPNDYNKKSLIINDNLKQHLTGNLELAQQRFTSYQYAVNSVGNFLTQLKKTKYANNTIVVVTADNNTIDGIMKYDDNTLFNSKNIPLYFYLPKELKSTLSINTKMPGSHKDVFPTLYNLTLENKNHISIGNNMFDNHIYNIGFNGSRLINNVESAKQLERLNRKTKNSDLQYYKASLAVTGYLLNQNIKLLERSK